MWPDQRRPFSIYLYYKSIYKRSKNLKIKNPLFWLALQRKHYIMEFDKLFDKKSFCIIDWFMCMKKWNRITTQNFSFVFLSLKDSTFRRFAYLFYSFFYALKFAKVLTLTYYQIHFTLLKNVQASKWFCNLQSIFSVRKSRVYWYRILWNIKKQFPK